MRVGVLGGGQLGRMLALAGHPLGITVTCLDPDPEAPAGQVGPLVTGAFEDPGALARLAAASDVVTYEFENVPLPTAGAIAGLRPLVPSVRALEIGGDRLHEKELFRRSAIPTPRFAAASTPEELARALRALDGPAMIKSRTQGYDGKGQALGGPGADAGVLWHRLGGVPLIVEELVAFDRELSLIAVRGLDGETVFYPLVENRHEDGILRMTRAPAPGLTPALQATAEGYARRALADLEYAGVWTIELFQVGDRLLANEFAPRVHNSGHWTIEGAETSQFENHLRAIAGMPLGGTAPIGACAMVNVIGEMPPRTDILAVRGARLHHYGKRARAGRKLGHVTLAAPDPGTLEERVAQLMRSMRSHPAAKRTQRTFGASDALPA